MIEISLGEFVDFVIKSGSPKLTVVRKIKNLRDEGYHPARDFWRKLREGLVEHHKVGRPKSALNDLADGVRDKNKIITYPLVLRGYRKFLGNKSFKWIGVRKRFWRHEELEVSVNPELGLRINGQAHLIKMYFKKDKPTKIQVASILHLMQRTLRSKKHPRVLGLLDVRRGHLIPAGRFDPSQTLLLQGEADAFIRMYNGL